MSTPAAPGIDLATAIRNCCEAEKADPDHPDTICINVNELTAIMEQCVIDASPKGGSADAKNAARYRWLRDESGNAASDTPTTIVQANEGGFDFVFGEALDSAIDAAMQATSAEVGT